MRKQQTSTDQPESTWDPCSRPCCVKPLPTTAIKVPASKELLLPDWECLRVSKYIKLLCHQLICYDKYAHYLWILLGHRCWPFFLYTWTSEQFKTTTESVWIAMNGPQSRPPVTGPESGVTNEIPRRGKSRTGKASASTKQSNEQLLKQEFAMSNCSRKQLKRNSAQKAPKSRKKT